MGESRPVILAQLFLLFAAVQAVRGQNMVLIAFVTGFNVYLVNPFHDQEWGSDHLVAA